jgi:hypothetical protein
VATVASPFASSGTAQRLPPLPVGERGRLTIRLDDAIGTDKIFILIDPDNLVTSTRAGAFLNAGESLEITGAALGTGKASDVSIIRGSGTGLVFFGVF